MHPHGWNEIFRSSGSILVPAGIHGSPVRIFQDFFEWEGDFQETAAGDPSRILERLAVPQGF